MASEISLKLRYRSLCLNFFSFSFVAKELFIYRHMQTMFLVDVMLLTIFFVFDLFFGATMWLIVLEAQENDIMAQLIPQKIRIMI